MAAQLPLEGKEKFLAAGTYPDVGFKDARKLLADGMDPGANRKATIKASRLVEA